MYALTFIEIPRLPNHKRAPPMPLVLPPLPLIDISILPLTLPSAVALVINQLPHIQCILIAPHLLRGCVCVCVCVCLYAYVAERLLLGMLSALGTLLASWCYAVCVCVCVCVYVYLCVCLLLLVFFAQQEARILYPSLSSRRNAPCVCVCGCVCVSMYMRWSRFQAVTQHARKEKRTMPGQSLCVWVCGWVWVCGCVFEHVGE
jgi:hypothetical protein